MNARRFFDLTASMRKAQKEFFSTHSKDALVLSKELERQVDDEITRVQNILRQRKQNGLGGDK